MKVSKTMKYNLIDAETNVGQTVGTARQPNKYSKMQKSIKFFLYSILGISLLFSCSKIQENNDSYNLELRSIGLLQFPEKMQQFWSKAHSELGMELLCSCTCDAVLAGQNFFNTNKNLLPDLCSDNTINFNCIELNDIVNLECKYTTSDSLHNYIKVMYNQLLDSNLVSIQEIALLEKIISESKSGLYDYTTWESKWLELPTNSISENAVSLVTIEGLKSIEVFIKNYNNNPLLDDDEPQAILNHLLSGLAGGLADVLYHCIKDTFKDYGYNGQGVYDDMADGFVVGAIMAI